MVACPPMHHPATALPPPKTTSGLSADVRQRKMPRGPASTVELVHRGQIVLLGGLAIPADRFLHVLGRADTLLEAAAEGVLRLGMILRRRFLQPAHGFLGVLAHTRSVEVADAQVVLPVRVALF